jgi:hypothetical protein
MSKLNCLLVALLIFYGSQLLAQDEATIRSIISEGDIKKLEKAEGYKSNADKIVEEANALNMEVFTVQADQTLSEKARTKKVAQLEEQSRQKQTEAASLYEKCNEIKFTVYKQYTENFWKTHEGSESDYLNAKLLEEQASDNYFQATSYRIEARKMDEGYAKVEKLNEAANLENQAIQKQVSALSAYHGLSQEAPSSGTPESSEAYQPPEVVTTPESLATPTGETNAIDVPPAEQDERTTSGNVVVNQSMIDAYNSYVATGHFTDTTLATGKIAGVTTFDSDQLLELWYEYIYGRKTLEPEVSPAEESDSTAALTEAKSNQQSGDAGNEKEIGIVTDENVGTLIPADDEVIYRVQIAANRNELSQRALSRMYYGNKNVEMINENGWYKYSVGDFTSYEEASTFRKSSGISNAFVVAYRKGTRFAQGPKAETEKTQTAIYTPVGENKLPSGILFRVQVAASRVALTTGQLKAIYSGNYPVEMISEDGWLKYQFMGVRLYSDALSIIQKVTSKGAFIVAYEDGNKIDLAEAVRKNKELEKTVKTHGRKGYIEEIEFHLQIAASKIAIPGEELKTLYGGPETVSVIYEEGWYKYHLKAGNSAEGAENFRQSCGVPKAFVVPYKRAAKISLYQAIQELK